MPSIGIGFNEIEKKLAKNIKVVEKNSLVALTIGLKTRRMVASRNLEKRIKFNLLLSRYMMLAATLMLKFFVLNTGFFPGIPGVSISC